MNKHVGNKLQGSEFEISSHLRLTNWLIYISHVNTFSLSNRVSK